MKVATHPRASTRKKEQTNGIYTRLWFKKGYIEMNNTHTHTLSYNVNGVLHGHDVDNRDICYETENRSE